MLKTSSKRLMSDASLPLPVTSELTDLCCIIDAFNHYCEEHPYSGRPANCGDEALDVHFEKRKRHEAARERQSKLLNDHMMAEATRLLTMDGIPLAGLNVAISEAGWKDLEFSMSGKKLVLTKKL